MNFAKLGLFLVLVLGSDDFISCERPAVVNIGAVLSYDSVIGTVAKPAIEAAVADVNSNKSILDGTRLNLIMENANCNAFMGTVADPEKRHEEDPPVEDQTYYQRLSEM